MSGLDFLCSLKGSWSGDNQLWLEPDKPPFKAPNTATLTPLLDGRFVRMDYNWSFEGEAQAGSYLFGYESTNGKVTAAWIDSWHYGEKIMICHGKVAENSGVNVLGFYPAPEGSDWGWRTVVEPIKDDAFHLLMYNITPQGVEMLAVEAIYSRAP
jgi:hypothetical protein